MKGRLITNSGIDKMFYVFYIAYDVEFLVVWLKIAFLDDDRSKSGCQKLSFLEPW